MHEYGAHVCNSVQAVRAVYACVYTGLDITAQALVTAHAVYPHTTQDGAGTRARARQPGDYTADHSAARQCTHMRRRRAP